MKDLTDVFKKLTAFLRQCKQVSENYILPSFSIDRIPAKTCEQVTALPIAIQDEFHQEYIQIIKRAKNLYGISVGAFIIFLLNGWIPGTLGVIGYWWYIKKYQLPNYANAALQRVISRHNLTESSKKTTFKPFSPPHTEAFRGITSARKLNIAYDPSNLTLANLSTGFLLDYNTKTWQVAAHYQYDWNNGTTELASRLVSNIDTRFLFMKEEGMQVIYVGQPLNIYAIAKDFDSQNNLHNILKFKKKDYFRENHLQGYRFDTSKKNAQGLCTESWEYYDAKRKNIIRIEKPYQSGLKTYFCQLTSEFAFSDILPK